MACCPLLPTLANFKNLRLRRFIFEVHPFLTMTFNLITINLKQQAKILVTHFCLNDPFYFNN